MAQARNNNNNHNHNDSNREPWFDLMAVEKKALKGKYSSSNAQVLNLSSFGLVMPHPEKASKGGEDAILVSKDGNTIGIADGVGGWADQGVDPSNYPRELFASAKKVVESGVRDPLTIMRKAYKANMNVTGSSTCCIATLNGQSILNIANLGDSGLIVIRAGKIVFKTTPQQVSFNFPYQLGTNSAYLPKDSEVKALRVIEGDIIIAASDGLWDNLWCTLETPEVLQIVNHARKLEKDLSALPKKIANELAESIYQVTRDDPNAYITPFSMHQGGQFGKVDDVSVIVSRVTKGSSSVEIRPFPKAANEKFIIPQEGVEAGEESDNAEAETPAASDIESTERSDTIQHSENIESVEQSDSIHHNKESIEEHTEHSESVENDVESTKQSQNIEQTESVQQSQNIEQSESIEEHTQHTKNVESIESVEQSKAIQHSENINEKKSNSFSSPLSEIHNSSTTQTLIESHPDTTLSLAFNIHPAEAQFSSPEIAANTQSEEAQTPFKPPTTDFSETQTPSNSPARRKFQLPLHKLNTTSPRKPQSSNISEVKLSPSSDNKQRSVNNNNNNSTVLVSPRSPRLPLTVSSKSKKPAVVKPQPQSIASPSPRKATQNPSDINNNNNNNNNTVPISPRSPLINNKNNKPVVKPQPQSNNQTKPSPRKATVSPSDINNNNNNTVPSSPRSPLTVSTKSKKPAVVKPQPQSIASPSPRKVAQNPSDINNNNNNNNNNTVPISPQTPNTPLLHNTYPITPKKSPGSHHAHCSSPLHFTPNKIKTTPPRQLNELVPINTQSPTNIDSLKKSKVGRTDNNAKNTPHTHTTPNQPFYQETDSYLLTYKNGTHHYHFYQPQSNQDGDDEDTIPFFVPEFERSHLLKYQNYDDPERRQSLKDALEPEKHRVIEHFRKQHDDSITKAKQEIVRLIKENNQGKKT